VLDAILFAWLALSAALSTAEARDRGHLRRSARAATPEYLEAIAEASRLAPPGEREAWGEELLRICRRESWCGRYGVVRVHEIDGWVGPRAYLGAWRSGKLSPETCSDHRLRDYGPIYRLAKTSEREAISSLPIGNFSARDFSTRGGFGTNAARGVSVLGDCVPPTALDIPKNAARVAVEKFRVCGDRCDCSDHVAMWVGVGIWKRRPLMSVFERSRVDSVRVQCGERAALTYVLRELIPG